MDLLIFCHQQYVINQKKTLKYKVQQICDVTMTLIMSHAGDVIVKTLKIDAGGVLYLAINAILPVR